MKLCDYSLGPGGGGGGKATEAMQLSHFSGRQVCYRRNAVNSTPKSLLSDRERGERSPFWHLTGAVCWRMKVLMY